MFSVILFLTNLYIKSMLLLRNLLRYIVILFLCHADIMQLNVFENDKKR